MPTLPQAIKNLFEAHHARLAAIAAADEGAAGLRPALDEISATYLSAQIQMLVKPQYAADSRAGAAPEDKVEKLASSLKGLAQEVRPLAPNDAYYDAFTAGSVAAAQEVFLSIFGLVRGAWELTGNAGTDANVEFVGTTDNQSLAVRTNGAERLRVDASGNLGIGTTSPQDALTVNGNSTLGRAQSSAGSAHAIACDEGSGYVGFQKQGTTQPGNMGLGNNASEIRSTSGNLGLFTVTPGYLALGTDNSERLRVDANGNVGIGTTSPDRPLSIKAQGMGQELISFKDPGDATKWHINQGSGGVNPGLNFVETGVADGRLFLKAGGNVGIGTSAPSSRLHVNGDAAVIGNLGVVQSGTQDGIRVSGGTNPLMAAADGTVRAKLQVLTPATQGLVGTETNHDFGIYTNNAPRVTVASGGNVGIGTTNPTAKLEINGDIRIDDNTLWLRGGTDQNHGIGWYGIKGRDQKVFAAQSVDGPVVFGFAGGGLGTKASGQEKIALGWDNSGNVTVTGDILLTGADCAEQFDVSGGQPLEPGTVVVIDEGGTLQESRVAYDKKVAGVVSGAGEYRHALVLDKRPSENGRVPVALVGKAYCKVDADRSPIQVGDLLTTSPTPGHAMKAAEPLQAFGSIIGKALGRLEKGQGLIPILVALQ